MKSSLLKRNLLFIDVGSQGMSGVTHKAPDFSERRALSAAPVFLHPPFPELREGYAEKDRNFVFSKHSQPRISMAVGRSCLTQPAGLKFLSDTHRIGMKVLFVYCCRARSCDCTAFHTDLRYFLLYPLLESRSKKPNRGKFDRDFQSAYFRGAGCVSSNGEVVCFRLLKKPTRSLPRWDTSPTW